MGRLAYWISATPGISHLSEDRDNVVAIAQHYRIPTTFIDFTTDPEIAGFFAADGDHFPQQGFEDSSCIYCINTKDFQDALEELREKSLPQLPRLVTINVDNLWRLEAQKGAFLDLPWDGQMLEGDFLSLLLPHDIIVFPYSGPALSPPRNRIYPQRKSGLEILLDEYFHNEIILAALEAHKKIHGGESVFAAMDGWVYDENSFLDGEMPPVHSSWDGAAFHKWRTTFVEESHEGVSTVVETTLIIDQDLDLESLKASCVDQILDFLGRYPEARGLLAHWRIVDPEGRHLVKPSGAEGDVPLSRCALEIWDGLRGLPYSDRNIAEAIATCLTLFAHDLRSGGEGISAAQALFGQTRCVEFGSAYGPGRRALIAETAILAAVREDFVAYVRRGEILQNARSLLSSIIIPCRVFDFVKFKDLFAAQVIPSQVHLHSQSGWRLFSPARIERFGLC